MCYGDLIMVLLIIALQLMVFTGGYTLTLDPRNGRVVPTRVTEITYG